MRALSKIFILVLLFVSHTLLAGPALWQIEKNGIRSYLFGTVHVGDKDMQGLPSKVKTALAKSDTLVVEVDITALSPQDIQRRSLPFMLLKEGRSLSDELSPENFQKLTSYFASKSIDIEALQRFTPWAVMLTLTQIEYQKAGFSDTFGIDKQILALAHQQGKKIKQLETLEQQMAMFGPLEPYGDEMVADTFRQLADIDRFFIRLISAWKQGNTQALEAYYDETFESSEFGRKSEQVMLINRNRNWINQLAPELISHPCFIAVGALHLPAENGLLSLLKQRGFNVTRL